MKRNFALFLTACLLAASLAACGEDKPGTAVPDSPTPETTPGGPDTAPMARPQGALPKTAQDSLSGGSLTGDSLTGGSLSGDSLSGDSLSGDSLSGITGRTTTSAMPPRETLLKPASYEQMLRNARVHDVDGYLTDNENSYTPGVSH